MSLVLELLGDTSNIKYQSETFPKDLKDKLYSLDYDNISLDLKESGIIDGDNRYYYCLVFSKSRYRLIKICQKGHKILTFSDKKLGDICSYIYKVLKKS